MNKQKLHFIICYSLFIFAMGCRYNDGEMYETPSISSLEDESTAYQLAYASTLIAIETISNGGGISESGEIIKSSQTGTPSTPFEVTCEEFPDNTVLQKLVLSGTGSDLRYKANPDKTPSRKERLFRPGNAFGLATGNHGFQNEGGVGNPSGIPPQKLMCKGTSGFPEVGWIYSNNAKSLEIEETFEVSYEKMTDEPIPSQFKITGSELSVFSDPLAVPPYADNAAKQVIPAEGYVKNDGTNQTLTITKQVVMNNGISPNSLAIIYMNDKNKQKLISAEFITSQSAPLTSTLVRNLAVENWPWMTNVLTSGTLLIQEKFNNKVKTQFSNLTFAKDSGCLPIEGTIIHSFQFKDSPEDAKKIIVRYGKNIRIKEKGNILVTEEVICNSTPECKSIPEKESKIFTIPFCYF